MKAPTSGRVDLVITDLRVAELLEPELAVVGAGARRADAAERQLVGGEVEQQMVDHHAAGRHLFDHPLADALGLGEEVGRQRLWPRVDETDCVVEGLNGHDRQDGSEDLVGHQRLGGVGVDDDGGLNAHRRRVRSAADDDIALGRGQRCGQPVEVTLVDNALAARVLGLEGRHCGLDLVDELVADLRVGQHIIRRDADLSGVDQLGPRDALGRDVDVGVGRDDHRALPPEFEGDRSEVRGGAFVNLAPDLGAAGEQEMVEALRDEFLADGAVALDHGDRVLVEVLRHQLGHQRRRRRAHLGGLEDARCCPRRWRRRRDPSVNANGKFHAPMISTVP